MWGVFPVDLYWGVGRQHEPVACCAALVVADTEAQCVLVLLLRGQPQLGETGLWLFGRADPGQPHPAGCDQDSGSEGRRVPARYTPRRLPAEGCRSGGPAEPA